MALKTSSKIMVLVAQPILTDGGPLAWAVDKRAELGWPSSRRRQGIRVARPLEKWPTFMLIYGVSLSQKTSSNSEPEIHKRVQHEVNQ